jgi:phosphate transport system protein
MQRHFEDELRKLKEQLLLMGGFVESAIAKSIQSLTERDNDLARQVIADDKTVDQLDLDVDNLCLRLLALYQPTAADLRFITASLLINNNLERMADQAVNIAQRVLELNEMPTLKPLIDIPRMSNISQEMTRDSLDAFVQRDAEIARLVRSRDPELDNLNLQVFRELLTYMMSDMTTITRAVNLILISRNLERIGDHATNIAEEVIFMVEGAVVKHTPPVLPTNSEN